MEFRDNYKGITDKLILELFEEVEMRDKFDVVYRNSFEYYNPIKKEWEKKTEENYHYIAHWGEDTENILYFNNLNEVISHILITKEDVEDLTELIMLLFQEVLENRYQIKKENK